MTTAARLAALAITWLLALTSPYAPVGVTAALVATLLAPGYLLDRAARSLTVSIRPPHRGEGLARALTLSVGLIALLGVPCALAHVSIDHLLVAIAITTTALAVFGADSPSNQTRSDDERARSRARDKAAFGVLLLAALVLVYMATSDHNIARDRMWYLAYVSKLAGGEPITWQEPFFGSGRVLARFAFNGWLLALAAWQRLSGMRAAFLFEHVAPPLLSLCVASASLAIARAMFGGGYKASIGALANLLVLLTTRYPFFSPERYPLFGRLPEDKTVALLVFTPVAVAICIDLLRARQVRAWAWAAAGFALVAVASCHALVYLRTLLALLPFGLWMLLGERQLSLRRALAFAALVAIVTSGPAVLGLRARAQILDSPDVVEALVNEATHPVVRSHLRMDRLAELPAGGPIVRPGLLADPVLLLALCGLVVAARRRCEPWAVFVLGASLPALALAFTPVLAPAFARIVLPWMAYRVLWAVPFGILLTIVILEAPLMLARRGGNAAGPRVVLALLVLALAALHFPMQRLAPQQEPGASGRLAFASGRLALSNQTLELLDAIARLPPSARIAAATGLAEVIPAYTGRSVLAFSDRGTIVFSGDRRSAEDRMQANAALLGLRGGSRRLRDRALARYDISHIVYQAKTCERKTAQVFSNATYVLCAERAHQRDRRLRDRRLMVRSSAAAGADPQDVSVVSLLTDSRCTPAPARSTRGDVYHWQRQGRWSGAPVSVDCSVRFDEPTAVGRLRLAIHLPRADEAIVYRIAVRTASGKLLRRSGALAFHGNSYGEIRLPDLSVTRIRVRLLPAYLPYLNLKELEVRR